MATTKHFLLWTKNHPVQPDKEISVQCMVVFISALFSGHFVDFFSRQLLLKSNKKNQDWRREVLNAVKLVELRFQTLMLQQAERWQSSASSRCLLSPGCYFDQKQQKITLIKAQVGSQVSLITIIRLTTFHLMERQVESVRWAKVSRPSSANLVSSL